MIISTGERISVGWMGHDDYEIHVIADNGLSSFYMSKLSKKDLVGLRDALDYAIEGNDIPEREK